MQPVVVGASYRYSKKINPGQRYLDGLPNFHHATHDPRVGAKMPILESGINNLALVQGLDGPRMPGLLIRSSPAKAGTEWTPWKDSIDLKNRVITYFGDHKPSTPGPLGCTKGNTALEQAWVHHQATGPAARLAAPPLLVFVTARWFDIYGGERDKGAVRFLGPAVMEGFEPITAFDDSTGTPYPNYRCHLRLTNMHTDEDIIDWRWINDRKAPSLTTEEAAHYEPAAWADWRWS